MNIIKSLKKMNTKDLVIWTISFVLITLTIILPIKKDYVNYFCSLIGITSLIFISNADPIGHVIGIIFGVIYAVISYYSRYYGEVIIYIMLMIPLSVISLITWLKNKYKNDEPTVLIGNLTKKDFLQIVILLVILVPIIFFILKIFNTNNLIISTISVATSLTACFLSIKRTPNYAIAFSVNDLVLITLWTIQTINNIEYISIVMCFIAFLINDIYGYFNWSKIKKEQR